MRGNTSNHQRTAAHVKQYKSDIHQYPGHCLYKSSLVVDSSGHFITDVICHLVNLPHAITYFATGVTDYYAYIMMQVCLLGIQYVGGCTAALILWLQPPHLSCLPSPWHLNLLPRFPLVAFLPFSSSSSSSSSPSSSPNRRSNAFEVTEYEELACTHDECQTLPESDFS